MPREVIIDGVRYAPVIESNPEMKSITKGLIFAFWGHASDEDLARIPEDSIYVLVNDNGRGIPLSKVLADIARELGSKS